MCVLINIFQLIHCPINSLPQGRAAASMLLKQQLRLEIENYCSETHFVLLKLEITVLCYFPLWTNHLINKFEFRFIWNNATKDQGRSMHWIFSSHQHCAIHDLNFAVIFSSHQHCAFTSFAWSPNRTIRLNFAPKCNSLLKF